MNRERGVYSGPCEFCGAPGWCRLTQYEDRWMWRCVEPKTSGHPPWKVVG